MNEPEVPDETVVVPKLRSRPRVTDPDETVVVPRPRPEPADPEATVVVPKPRPEPTDPDATVVVVRPRAAPVDPDATVVVSRPRRALSEDRQSPAGAGPGEIIETDELTSAAPARAVYGARSVSAPSPSIAAEGVNLPFEDLSQHPPLAERSGLPSLARRFKRKRVLTLIGYAGAVLLSIGGIIVVVNTAFNS